MEVFQEALIKGLSIYLLIYLCRREYINAQKRNLECLKSADDPTCQSIVIETKIACPHLTGCIICAVLIYYPLLFGAALYGAKTFAFLPAYAFAFFMFGPMVLLLLLYFKFQSNYVLDLKKKQIVHVMKLGFIKYEKKICSFSNILSLECDRYSDGNGGYIETLVAVCRDGSRKMISHSYNDETTVLERGEIIASRLNKIYRAGITKPGTLHYDI